MRLFTGIDLPEELVANLNRLLDALRPTAHLRWTAPYNFHITTKFIGEWPEEKLPALIERLQPLGNRPPIEPVDVSGIGWFPNPQQPRILWMGIKASPELGKLASDTNEALAAMGIERESKKFTAHLTLARIKDAVPLTPLRQAIASLDSTEFGSFQADRFHLYLSQPGPSGPIYTKLAEIPLIPE